MDEGSVALKSGYGVGIAQKRPFNDFLRYRVVDRCGERCRVGKFALPHQRDCLLRRGKVR